MTAKEFQQVNVLVQKLKNLNVPAIVLAFDGKEFLSVKNCSEETVSQLLVNQIESTEKMKAAFVKELQLITEKELEKSKKP